jgi:inorganic pyrophosphatase
MEHFFSTYKQLEDVTVQAQGRADSAAAFVEVAASVERYRTRTG